ncbi:MAG: DNA adenine methylase [Candidatus Caldarchaeum sp.]
MDKVMIASPLAYVGGKRFMIKYIVPIIEAYEHTTYVEPFGGAAHILLAKKPSKVEVYNDINDIVVNFFKVLADKELSQELVRQVSILPYSRKLFKESTVAMYKEQDPVKRAVAFFIVSKQSFAGNVFGNSPSWSFSVLHKKTTLTWERCPRALAGVHARLRMVQIDCLDFRRIFKNYDRPTTLFYCDPPYVLSTRYEEYYRHEMSDDDHKELVDILLRISGAAIVSGYRHEIYDRLVANGWMSVDIPVTCFARHTRDSSKRPTRTEVLWIHPRIAEAVDVNRILAQATGKKKRAER